MQMKRFLSAAALAATALAQTNSTNTTMSLNATLAGNSNLSNLTSLLAATGLLSQLNGLSNITVLAPSNAAISAFLASAGAAAANNTALVTAILRYHVLPGIYDASAITNTSVFVPTLLTDTAYTNVSGGQVVEAINIGGNVTFFSGLGANSTVTTPNVNFTGGVAHIIDHVLTVPDSVATTGVDANLTALIGALNATNILNTVDSLSNITVFAPNNAAFQSVASSFANASTATLTSVLEYHVVEGTIGYSTDLTSGMTLNALSGGQLKITINNGSVFVNNAQVVRPNVLIANGVLHVIDEVLNPSNTTATASPSATSGVPAFNGTSASSVPFTSNVAATSPATTVGGGAGAASTSAAAKASSTGAAAPIMTGAVGAAALFGAGAAALFAY